MSLRGEAKLTSSLQRLSSILIKALNPSRCSFLFKYFQHLLSSQQLTHVRCLIFIATSQKLQVWQVFSVFRGSTRGSQISQRQHSIHYTMIWIKSKIQSMSDLCRWAVLRRLKMVLELSTSAWTVASTAIKQIQDVVYWGKLPLILWSFPTYEVTQ